MKKRGLGKGIGSLLGSEPHERDTDPMHPILEGGELLRVLGEHLVTQFAPIEPNHYTCPSSRIFLSSEKYSVMVRGQHMQLWNNHRALTVGNLALHLDKNYEEYRIFLQLTAQLGPKHGYTAIELECLFGEDMEFAKSIGFTEAKNQNCFFISTSELISH